MGQCAARNRRLGGDSRGTGEAKTQAGKRALSASHCLALHRFKRSSSQKKHDGYKGPKASDAALAFLSLGAANQFASTAYLAVARRAKNKGHEKGLLVALLTNAIATLKFGVLDADKAGFEKVGSFVWTAVVSLLASVVKAKSSSAAVEESD